MNNSLKEEGHWRLESEPSDPRRGIFAFGMNPKYISVHKDPSTGKVMCGNATIHKYGDNISKPDIPTLRRANYFYGT